MLKKLTPLELLPPDPNSWEALIHAFLSQPDIPPQWARYRARLVAAIQNTSPHNGVLTQLTVDETCIDTLYGRQRILISVLCYHWRTEAFRKVSLGFVGILAMVGAIGDDEKTNDAPLTWTAREPPLAMDATVAREIYKLIEPNLVMKKLGNDQIVPRNQDARARVSRQLRSMGDEGKWKEL